MLATQTKGSLVTRTGFTFYIRPARPYDEAALGSFFNQVTPDDKRFRFLTAVKEVAHDRLVALTDIDHDQTENFLAFDPDTDDIVATGMLACDPQITRGEVAISVRSDYKGRGISWVLLAHIAAYAETRGLKTIESVESKENHAAISLAREMGFIAQNFPGDASLTLVKKNLT